MIEGVPFEALPGNGHASLPEYPHRLLSVFQLYLATVLILHKLLGDIGQGHAIDSQPP